MHEIRKEININRMNVLSLFDGMSCTRLALRNLKVSVDNYYASEIDKYAIEVTQANFPDTIQLGDVRDLSQQSLNFKIFLVVAGSPCQDLSFASSNGKGLIKGERSNLFFEFVRILEEFKPKYFLLENTRMKQEYEDIITDTLGVSPVAVNSSLVSAQNRYRLYWFGVREGNTYKKITVAQPKDRDIILADILEDNTKRIRNGKRYTRCIQIGETAEIKGFDVIKRVYSPEGKAPTLTTMQGGHREPKISTTDPKGGRLVSNDELHWRKLSEIEMERLQTVPDNYTNHVSRTQRYKMLGNGMTVDVIAYLLKQRLENEDAHDL